MSNQKTSKVTKCYNTGESFPGKDKKTGQPNGQTISIYEIEFEDGTKGKTYTTASKAPAAPGDTVTYSVNEKGSVRIYPAGGGGGWKGGGDSDDRQLSIIRQSSLKVACEFITTTKGKAATLDEIFSAADEIVEWVQGPAEEKSEDNE